MPTVKSAMDRLKRRRHYPTGERIVTVRCQECGTEIWCWDDDPLTLSAYPYKKKCSHCREIDKAIFRRDT